MNLLRNILGEDTEEKRIKQIWKLSEKCKKVKQMKSEEATKMSLILPLISALGYDIHNEKEVIAEYYADVGTKRGERVDYAIAIDGEIKILIEAKRLGVEPRGALNQLFRYFSATTAKVGIITDGVEYLFYTDSGRKNIMDLEPYLYINMRTLDEDKLEKLLNYSKSRYNDGVIREHIAYEKLYGIISNIVNSILEEDIDGILLEYIKESIGIENINPEAVNRMIKNEIDNIVCSNERIERARKIDRYNTESGEQTELNGQSNEDRVYSVGEVSPYGKKLDYAIIFGKRHDNISYANILVETLDALNRMDRKYVESLLEDDDFYTGRYRKITRNKKETRKPRELECGGVYVESHAGSVDLIKLVEQVLIKCGLDKSNVKLKFK